MDYIYSLWRHARTLLDTDLCLDAEFKGEKGCKVRVWNSSLIQRIIFSGLKVLDEDPSDFWLSSEFVYI